MNLFNERIFLINQIENYLNNKCSLESVRAFAWDIIAYFSNTNKEQLPEHQDFEKEFWYTIWEIQHLGDQDHENDGLTKKILSEALQYLNKQKKIPESFIGLRP